MTDKEKRAHDLAMLLLSHGVNHMGADGQGFSFEMWEKAIHGCEDGCDFITENYQQAYKGVGQVWTLRPKTFIGCTSQNYLSNFSDLLIGEFALF